jgi:hypothetical protein
MMLQLVSRGIDRAFCSSDESHKIHIEWPFYKKNDRAA